MRLALELAQQVGVKPACEALGVPRSTLYRLRRPRLVQPRAPHHRRIEDAVRQQTLAALHSDRFVDASPDQVYATLLDEGVYLCSVSTMYRILRQQGSVRERRAQRRHPVYVRPQLVARAPRQVWTWDITKIRGSQRRVYYHLYAILDIFSRYVVGWMLAKHESGSLARRFIQQTLDKEGIGRHQLVLHSDRGTSMRSKTVAEMLDDLGVTKSHSRPRTSNDNPFSESQFKTLKYSAYFPGQFGSVAQGREFLRLFFGWYNDEHHHSGIAMLTPTVVHHGRVEQVLAGRQRTLDAAHAAHPERFVRGPPKVARPPAEVWINRPCEATVPVGEVGES